MPPPPKTIRRLLNVGLALLIVAASLHCAWEWQVALKQIGLATSHSRARLPLPLGETQPGCNESGCICRGATIAPAVTVAGLHSNTAQWLPISAEASSSLIALPAGPSLVRFGEACHAPPISGRQLRALYASLVI